MRKEEQIKIIMNEFDFNAVHSTLTHLKRTWSFEIGENKEPVKKIPTIADLKSIAEHCLNKVADSKESSAIFFICGFQAEKIENTLELCFILDRVNPLSQLLNTGAKNELARKS
jgi:hypothetical protein